ncbi:MAG: 2-dehydropantoate 2-reductase [Gammaproteobacteria bacterium]|nr:2-dehydropantoate 2-reductase [Gammaproteobacteria bacterium]
MRIAIVGAGGIGGFYAAKLAQAGEEVVLIARGAHLAAIREHGLRVEGLEPALPPLRLNATDDPREVGPVDVTLICTKIYDIEDAARAILPIMGPDSFAITQQNGVEAGTMLRPILGPERVLDGVSYVSGHIDRPGVVRAHGAVHNAIEFGEADNRISPRARAFSTVCANAGFIARIPENIQTVLWHKFIIAASFAGIMTLTRMPIGPVRADPDTRRALAAALAEAAAVARARGIELPANLVEELFRFADALPHGLKASMLEDIEHGRRLEVAWLSGAVERLGRQVGVPTPVHAAIYAGLKLHAGGAAQSVR